MALIDLLRRVEGTAMRADGPLIRAAIDLEVCSMGDMMTVEDGAIEECAFHFPYSYGSEVSEP